MDTSPRELGTILAECAFDEAEASPDQRDAQCRGELGGPARATRSGRRERSELVGPSGPAPGKQVGEGRHPVRAAPTSAARRTARARLRPEAERRA